MIHPDIPRAFFHEIGHYLTREINFTRGKMGATKEMVFLPHEVFPEYYRGYIRHDDPDSSEANAAERLTNNIQGCFFECVLKGEDLDECFFPNKSGSKDLSNWDKELGKMKIDSGSQKAKKLWAICDDYLASLRGKELLKNLFSLDVEKFLLPQKSGYVVNLEMLKTELLEFQTEYEKIYLPYLERMRTCLNSTDLSNTRNYDDLT
jgi:hypothetical protein